MADEYQLAGSCLVEELRHKQAKALQLVRQRVTVVLGLGQLLLLCMQFHHYHLILLMLMLLLLLLHHPGSGSEPIVHCS